MELSFDEVFQKLESKKIKMNNDEILKYLNDVYFKTLKILSILKKNNISGYENINGMGSESNEIRGNQGTNPMMWEFGHIAHFYDYHCLRYLFNRKDLLIKNGYIYDSFLTDREMRYIYKKNNKNNKNNIFEYYNEIHRKLNLFLKKNIIDEKMTYLLLLTILHNHMHCESLLFTSKLLGF